MVAGSHSIQIITPQCLLDSALLHLGRGRSPYKIRKKEGSRKVNFPRTFIVSNFALLNANAQINVWRTAERDEHL